MTQKPTVPEFTGTIHLVCSTHWDREWYLPFQKFRAKLVHILDVVLDELESGHLPRYQMDGQFIPVEDYLQIRPEKEPLLRRLIAEGRFQVGPWYNLPDGFLVSGESIVRNFQMGMRRAEAMGQTATAGWLCDLFGHNSQMPQILNGLGLSGALLWRGVPTSIGNPFWWRGPDGSRVLVHRFPRRGYGEATVMLRQAWAHAEPSKAEQMVERALEYIATPLDDSRAQNRLWCDGADHIYFDPAVVEFVTQFNERMGREAVKISSFDDFLNALQAEELPDLQEVVGELREPAHHDLDNWVIPGTASSRMPLKRANHAGELLLTLWAEPWCAAASAQLSKEYPARSLELAWEYLIKNHPHDSIAGCSTDETHAAMPYRFEQSKQIAEAHLDEALDAISAHALRPLVQDDEIGFSLFTPFSGSIQQSPELSVRLPLGWPQFNEFFGFEPKPSFRIFDLEGNEIPYQLLEVTPQTMHRRYPLLAHLIEETRQGIRFAVDAALEPGTASHFVIRRAEGPTRIAQTERIGIAADLLRNEFIEVQAQRDGTLSITDRQSGFVYNGLLAMEDTADIGDGYYHGVALQDVAHLSTGGQVTFGLTKNGPLLARLKIRVEWLVPGEYNFQTNRRSSELVPLIVEHVVTLRKNTPHVEIETTVHNNVRDHRLRILCPSGIDEAETYWVDSPFDAVERAIALRPDNHLLRELQTEMGSQQNWCAIAGENRGLALLAPGQYESAVLDQPEHPLCVTLLRAFRRAVGTDGNEGGQIQGSHTIKLGIMPFAPVAKNAVPAVELYRTAHTLACPVRSVFMNQPELMQAEREHLGAAKLAQNDYPYISGDFVLSACYQSPEGQWNFRVFNPTDSAQSIKLASGFPWQRTDMRENGAVMLEHNSVELEPHEIVTIRTSHST